MNNYFDRKISRVSATARIPEKISDDLIKLRDLIRSESGLKISKNDLITLSAIILAETVNEADQTLKDDLKKAQSLNDLLEIFKGK